MENVQKNIRETRKVLAVILVLNWTISIIKIVVGLISNSTAILANGLESFADGASNIVGLIALKSAAKPADDDHPYGHGKFETFATAIIASFLLITGLTILSKGGQALIGQIFFGIEPAINYDVNLILVLGATIFVNIFIVKFELKKGKELKSSILIADAMHTKTDVLSTGAVIISFFVASYIPLIDPLMSVVIGIIILKASFEIFMDITNTLGDKKKIDENEIMDLFVDEKNIKAIHSIRTRGVDNQIFADLIIELDGKTSLWDAHELSNVVEEKIKNTFPEVVDVVVHMEPHGNQHI